MGGGTYTKEEKDAMEDAPLATLWSIWNERKNITFKDKSFMRGRTFSK